MRLRPRPSSVRTPTSESRGRVAMRRFIGTALASSLMLGVAGTAMAADLPVKAPRVAPVAAPVAYNWSGFYIGGFGGGAWLRTNRSYDVVGDHFVPGLVGINHNTSGAVA